METLESLEGQPSVDRQPQEEILKIIEKFIILLITSGYDRAQAREAVLSGIRGWGKR